jgi:hypothetical protein
MTKSPTPQGISALLRKAGFTRSNYGDKGVMLDDVTTGYSVWKTWHVNHPNQPYVAVQYLIKGLGCLDWAEAKQDMLAHLEEYAAPLIEAGYAPLVRDRGDEPPWLTIMTVVEAAPSPVSRTGKEDE